MLPNHWQHPPSLLGQALPSIGAYSPPRTESTGTSHNDSICHNPESSFPNAPSGRPSAPPKSHSSRRCQIFLREYHSELDISSRHCVTSRAATLSSSSETFSFDRRHSLSIAGFAHSPPLNLCCTDRVMDTIPTRGAPTPM
ncbi:hypothetical protein BC827DRAFT_175352 [Russula dissimulans]|nr:hypothetical protein BC827DRAFT_175352 [Russula dissimulans]